ncbi:hypothetical protein TEA_012815 [Camellia sinensis var. sinensis]|uniref:S1 motif domain-containing protein n=1 Tax=Camellia sinensis var. sinensis TaxID=542762 RepID=A0A4S4D2G6_CAMSN|nr:hypothetical protein TEA_012815 [Camellia sinensis var. sinensis]
MEDEESVIDLLKIMLPIHLAGRTSLNLSVYKRLCPGVMQVISTFSLVARVLVMGKIWGEGVHWPLCVYGSELGLDPGDDPTSLCHVEQVVKCRVTSSVPASRRINLSFVITPARSEALFLDNFGNFFFFGDDSNVIVITLLAKSNQLSCETPAINNAETDLYNELIKNIRNEINYGPKNCPPVPESKEIVYKEKQIVSKLRHVWVTDDDVAKLGTIVSGVVERVTPHAAIVRVNAKGYTKGTISAEHLSDHQGLVGLMKSVLKPGYEFDQLLVLGTQFLSFQYLYQGHILFSR